MGSSQQGVLTGRMRHGYGQYFMGTSLLFISASAIHRMTQRPYVLGGLAILWGWIKSALQRKARYQDPEFRRFLRRYHWRVLLVGKKCAVDDIRRQKGLIPSQ